MTISSGARKHASDQIASSRVVWWTFVGRPFTLMYPSGNSILKIWKKSLQSIPLRAEDGRNNTWTQNMQSRGESCGVLGESRGSREEFWRVVEGKSLEGLWKTHGGRREARHELHVSLFRTPLGQNCRNQFSVFLPGKLPSGKK